MITRLKKEEQVKALSEYIGKATAGFLVNFHKLNVQQVTEMRKKLKNEGLGDMKVCRNTLIGKALDSYPDVKKHFSASLNGSSAFVFAFGEPSKVAKIISDYVEKTETLQIKTGMLEGKGISLNDIKELAALPSIEVLQAKLLSVLSAPMSKLLSVCSAVPQGLMQVVSSYKDKKKDSKASK